MRAVGVAIFCGLGLAPSAEAGSAATLRLADETHKFPPVTGPAQPGVPGHVVVPDSSIERPGDIGRRAHTNVEIFVPGRRDGPPQNHPDTR